MITFVLIFVNLILTTLANNKNINCKEYDVPLIDIGLFENGNKTIKNSIAKVFDNSFHNIGVVKLVNYGISAEIIDKAYQGGKKFFYLSQNEKLAYKLLDTAKCGYTPMGGLIQSDIGYDLVEMYFLQLTELKYKNEKIDFGVNGNDSLLNIELMLSAFEYIQKLKKLLKTIHVITGMALELDNINIFNDMNRKSELYYQVFVYLYYPEMQNRNESNFNDGRLSEHRDGMTYTLVKPDNIQGLQLFVNNEWYNLKTKNNEIVLFAGDAMNVYTNNYWISPLHRVILNENKERMAMSYFTGPDYDQIIEPLKCKKCNYKKPLFKPRTVEQQFRKVFDDVVET